MKKLIYGLLAAAMLVFCTCIPKEEAIGSIYGTVLDKESGEYKEIELSHQYIMATLDYLILEQGASGIFNQVKPISTYWGADIEILRHYLEDSLGGYVGVEYSEPQGRIIFK